MSRPPDSGNIEDDVTNLMILNEKEESDESKEFMINMRSTL